MKLFSTPDSKYKGIIDQYIATKEIAQISMAVGYNGTYYREIQFSKKTLLGKPGKKFTGILFIDEQDMVVTDKRMQKELFSAFFNLERLFDESFLTSLSRSVISDSEIEREKAEAEFIASVLADLAENQVEGASRVRDIVLRLPQLKKENNQAISNFLEQMRIYDGDLISYDDIICKLKPLYIETLMKNFEKIKVIASGNKYYESIRKEAMKSYKKRFVGMMGSSTSREGSIIDMLFSHLMKVNELYSEVVGFSNSEYIKYLNENEKLLIGEMTEKNRCK